MDESNTQIVDDQAREARTGAAWVSTEFEAIYQEHARAIYYAALRLLGEPALAEDATHDVFLKAFRKIHEFRGQSAWRTWLYRIAINHCLNLRRSRGTREMSFSNV